ncbi:hypothetical protein [Chryseobacterium nakagawai]|nr:hypothetical protein [Chryseobacterium nakagawai]
MKKMKINYDQLLFLYAYLRLIDLSLDRSRWTSWGELQDYFKTILAPSLVVQYVINRFNLPKTDLKNFTFYLEEKSLINRLRPILLKKIPLKQNEILYCCKLLFDFDQVLNSDNKIYNVEIEKLRIDIATYYSDFLGRMILWEDLDKLMKVEHFWQNDKIETIELKNFIPADFE